MVKHCVMLKITAAATDEAVGSVLTELAALKDKIPGIVDFAVGANSSPEGLSHGFTHAFVTTFASGAARDGYLVHPAHQALVGNLLPLLEGGAEGVIVVDFEME
jgi:hypothetical protein